MEKSEFLCQVNLLLIIAVGGAGFYPRFLFVLFVLGFNVSLTLFQSNCDGTCMSQVSVLPHWNAPVIGT